ncbi:MAG: VWA domain-containing protein, partial [Vicinamibacterales bacterium]
MKAVLHATVVLAAVVAAATLNSVTRAQTFRAGVDAVQVDVLVTRGGRPVGGLTAADFELRDSGVVQSVDAVAEGDVPVTLSLVLDASQSVAGQPLDHLRNAIGAAAEALAAEDRLSLLTFSHHIGHASGPTADVAQVRAAADAMTAEGATALYDAAFAGLALRDRVEGRMVMLLFSDGADTASWLDPRAVITAAQRSDVVVYGVTLQQVAERENLAAVARIPREQQWFAQEPTLFGRQFLPLLAAETGGAVLVAERSEQLRETFVRVLRDFKSRYILTYTPQGVAPDGWHPIEVRLKSGAADVAARRG